MFGECIRVLVLLAASAYASGLWAQGGTPGSAQLDRPNKVETASSPMTAQTPTAPADKQSSIQAPEEKPSAKRVVDPRTSTAVAPSAAPQGPQPSRADAPSGDLVVAGKNGGNDAGAFVYTLRDRFVITATGDVATEIRKELTKPAASRTLALYFDGIRMASFPAGTIDFSNAQEIRFQFHIVRDPSDEQNRKAWDTLLGSKDSYVMSIEPALAVGSALPRTVRSEHDVKLYVAPPARITWTFIACLGAFVVLFWYAVRKTDMLIDRETGYYSLGKSQMAFWGLLVLLAFIGVWIATRTMEHIPPQTLVLLGISGATGLSAVLIGTNKDQGLQTRAAELAQERAKLRAEQSQSVLPAEKSAKLDEVEKELERISAALAKADRSSHRWRDFWRDICDDGEGASFHRLQVVLWTLVLGVIFVRYVANVMSMPEFPETLLVLMGISNATYLGFKIPEKT